MAWYTVVLAALAVAVVVSAGSAMLPPYLPYTEPRYFEIETAQDPPSLGPCLAATLHLFKLWGGLVLYFPRTALVLVVVPLVAFVLSEVWRIIVKCWRTMQRRVTSRFRKVKNWVGERSEIARA